MTTYTIEVQTGNRDDAGTDADVFIQLIGAKGTSSEQQLDNQEDNFEKGKLDRFQLKMEDVGWINSIRVSHNNENRKPGWYVDWVKVTNEDLGLSFKANFSRWLAKDEGDRLIDVTVPVPVNTVSLSTGNIVSCFMGYGTKRRSNASPTKATYTETFSSQFKQGMALKKGNSWTISNNTRLGAEFFGLTCEFTVGVSKTIVNELSTSEEQTVTATSDVQFALDPNQAITAVALYYQNILKAEALANGVKMEFENKFFIDQDTFLFDGTLSDGEVDQRVTELVNAMAGLSTGALHTHVPQKEAFVPIYEHRVSGTLNATNIKGSLVAIPKHWLKQEHLAKVAGTTRLVKAIPRQPVTAGARHGF